MSDIESKDPTDAKRADTKPAAEPRARAPRKKVDKSADKPVQASLPVDAPAQIGRAHV